MVGRAPGVRRHPRGAAPVELEKARGSQLIGDHHALVGQAIAKRISCERHRDPFAQVAQIGRPLAQIGGRSRLVVRDLSGQMMDPCLIGRHACLDLYPYGLEKLLILEKAYLEADDAAGKLAGLVHKPAQSRERPRDGPIEGGLLGARVAGSPSRAAGFRGHVQNTDREPGGSDDGRDGVAR